MRPVCWMFGGSCNVFWSRRESDGTTVFVQRKNVLSLVIAHFDVPWLLGDHVPQEPTTISFYVGYVEVGEPGIHQITRDQTWQSLPYLHTACEFLRLILIL